MDRTGWNHGQYMDGIWLETENQLQLKGMCKASTRQRNKKEDRILEEQLKLFVGGELGEGRTTGLVTWL